MTDVALELHRTRELIILRCPRCGGGLAYRVAPDREFVAAYCLCRDPADPRRSGAHDPVRMVVTDPAERL